MAVIIEIAHTGGLRPTGSREGGLLTHFRKVTLAVVVVKLRARGRPTGVERGSVGDKEVVGAVAVVIENRCACAGAFDEVVFLVFTAEGVGNRETRLGGDVDEM